ncbi:MAG: YkgJ family cysteine cluster protein [Paludibacter sp.]|nr:YkgJ family cysteine cluster protein [Paludibacter sp.]
MQNTILKLSDKLPLTCSRAGNCCHGNKVLLNPWELACLAAEKKISAREFRDSYTEWCGVRLLFNGAVGYNGKQACSQYAVGTGCSVHVARPLACRLFPLGRQIQNNETIYMHQGTEFPCLDGCEEVLKLPHISVAEYLTEQQTGNWELAQNAYLEAIQLLADVAFELLLDSKLAESGDKKTLQQWRLMEKETPEQLAERIGQKWLDSLTVPDLTANILKPQLFCEQHVIRLQEQMQASFGNAQTLEELHDAAVLVMALALLLSVGVGAEPELLVNHWIDIAKSNGAQE